MEKQPQRKKLRITVSLFMHGLRGEEVAQYPGLSHDFNNGRPLLLSAHRHQSLVNDRPDKGIHDGHVVAAAGLLEDFLRGLQALVSVSVDDLYRIVLVQIDSKNVLDRLALREIRPARHGSRNRS